MFESNMNEEVRQSILAIAEDALSFSIAPLLEMQYDEDDTPDSVGTCFLVYIEDVEGKKMAVRMPPEAMQKFTEMAAQTWVAYALSVGLPVVPPPAPGLVLPNA